MGQREPFALNEYYHCYNRGTDKKVIFENQNDYVRFLKLLYVSNSIAPIRISELHNKSLTKILKLPRSGLFVEIIAYSLMPNHYHLVLLETSEGGITAFMRRVNTAYTMYFNASRERSGALFQGKFKAKHIGDDLYLKQVINYIHLNPLELGMPNWKNHHAIDTKTAENFLKSYKYSSLPDLIQNRPEKQIISKTVFELLENISDVEKMIDSQRMSEVRP